MTGFCGVLAQKRLKTPLFAIFYRIYIIEAQILKHMKKNITNRNIQSAESLLKDAAEQPLLTCEQEIKKGNEEAFKELYNCNLRFVTAIAKQYQNKGLTLEELIVAGNKGLEIAAKKYTPQSKFIFIAYAVWWIRQSILAAISEVSNGEDVKR